MDRETKRFVNDCVYDARTALDKYYESGYTKRLYDAAGQIREGTVKLIHYFCHCYGLTFDRDYPDFDKIIYLERNGYIDSNVARGLHVCRIIGNKGVHVEECDVSAEEIKQGIGEMDRLNQCIFSQQINQGYTNVATYGTTTNTSGDSSSISALLVLVMLVPVVIMNLRISGGLHDYDQIELFFSGFLAMMISAFCYSLFCAFCIKGSNIVASATSVIAYVVEYLIICRHPMFLDRIYYKLIYVPWGMFESLKCGLQYLAIYCLTLCAPICIAFLLGIICDIIVIKSAV